jgi:hypothetical protein
LNFFRSGCSPKKKSENPTLKRAATRRTYWRSGSVGQFAMAGQWHPRECKNEQLCKCRLYLQLNGDRSDYSCKFIRETPLSIDVNIFLCNCWAAILLPQATRTEGAVHFAALDRLRLASPDKVTCRRPLPCVRANTSGWVLFRPQPTSVEAEDHYHFNCTTQELASGAVLPPTLHDFQSWELSLAIMVVSTPLCSRRGTT